MADDVNVTFGANITGLTQATEQIRTQFGHLNSVADSLSASFGRLASVGSLLFTGLSLVGLDSFVRNLADSGVEAERLSAALGITGKQFGELKAAAALSGVGIEALAMSIERMSLQIQRSTRDAFTPQAAALKVLGISAKDLIGLSADQYFLKIAEAASKFNPSLNLTNALMTIGGRSMANMVAAYTKGTDEIKRFQQEMQRTKIGQEGFYAAAADTHRQLLLMDSAVDGLNKQLFMALKPTLDIIISRTKDFAISIRDNIKEGGGWGTAIDTIVVAMKGLITVIILTGAAFEGLTIIAANTWKSLIPGLLSFQSGVNVGKAALDSLKKTTEVGESSMDQFRSAARTMADELERVIKLTEVSIKKLWANLEAETKKHPPGVDAERMNLELRKAFEMQLKAIDGQIALLETSLERKKILYDKDVLNLGITELQKINLVSQATQQKYEAEIGFLQQKLKVAGMDIAQQQDIQNQITLLTQKALNDRLRAQNEAAREIQAQWGNFLNTIQSSFQGQLRGLLQGTTTWKNAMKSIFTDIVVWAISEFTKLAVIKPMIASLSEAFAPTEIFASIIKMIMKMIGQVFAGATAFFAPTLGPAAPAAGAAVAGATEAAALSYDTGAWSVPQTAHALVHRDEMILPVDFASAVRSAMTGGAFGGSSNLTLSIQAWDGASVARWLRTGGADVLARAISAQYNQNPTIRPRY